MRKALATILVVSGLAVIVAGLSIAAFPEWLSLPGGVLLLLAAAFTGVADLGDKLKSWSEFLFGDKGKTSEKSPPTGETVPTDAPAVEAEDNQIKGGNKINIRGGRTRFNRNKINGKNELTIDARTGPKPKN